MSPHPVTTAVIQKTDGPNAGKDAEKSECESEQPLRNTVLRFLKPETGETISVLRIDPKDVNT